MSTLADLYKLASEEKDRSTVIMPALEGAAGVTAIGAGGVAAKKAIDKVKNIKEANKSIEENKKTKDALKQRAANEKALYGEIDDKINKINEQNKGILNKIKNVVSKQNVNAEKNELVKNKKELLKDIAKSQMAADNLDATNKEIAEFAKANKKAGLLYGLGAVGLTAAGLGLGTHAAKSFIGEQNN